MYTETQKPTKILSVSVNVVLPITTKTSHQSGRLLKYPLIVQYKTNRTEPVRIGHLEPLSLSPVNIPPMLSAFVFIHSFARCLLVQCEWCALSNINRTAEHSVLEYLPAASRRVTFRSLPVIRVRFIQIRVVLFHPPVAPSNPQRGFVPCTSGTVAGIFDKTFAESRPELLLLLCCSRAQKQHRPDTTQE